MWKDPIVEEIHAVREEIARRFNYDMDQIVAYFKKREEANAHRIVTKEELARSRAALEAEGAGRKDGGAPESLTESASAP